MHDNLLILNLFKKTEVVNTKTTSYSYVKGECVYLWVSVSVFVNVCAA